jgi:hypothetical protein
MRALATMYRDGHELFLTTQNVAEFWNVCTRPVDVNGFGLSIQGADRYTAQLERLLISQRRHRIDSGSSARGGVSGEKRGA